MIELKKIREYYFIVSHEKYIYKNKKVYADSIEI